MLKAMLLAVALQASDLSYQELEKFYWDCDTAFMKGELGGQDTWSCLNVTEEFQKHFDDKSTFKDYWNKNKQLEWSKRGYRSYIGNS